MLATDVPQGVIAATEIVPPAAPAVVVMLAVVDVPVHPEGIVQAYPVAPLTGATLYVCEEPVHTVSAPVMPPMAPGAAPEETTLVLGEDVPQAFDAVTEIVPPVAVGTAVMEVVEDEPPQPAGSVHA